MIQIDKEATLTQLSRICMSKEFSTKPLMSKFVSYLVNEYVEERGDGLKGYTIAIDLFKQDEHFDPDQNALVRIHAGRLRRSLKTYYQEEGKEDPILIEVPKGRYCPVITSKDNTSLTSTSEIAFTTSRNISDNTIAVLPFKNHSKDNELDHLAIGFSLELSDAMTKFQDLKVIGINKEFSNSISYAETRKQLRNKGISFIIDGDVMALGNQVKISFRLIHIPDDSQLWASKITFDKEKDNLFEIQEKVSHYIISHLSGAYGHVNEYRYQKLMASKPVSINEQELLLKFYHAQTVLTPEAIMELYKLADEVFEREPNSVLATALLASANSTIYTHDLPGAEDAGIKYRDLAEKAYQLNPNHKIAFNTIVGKCFHFNERDRLYRLYEAGEKWVPNTPMGMGLFGLWFSYLGDWEFGKELIDRLFEENMHIPTWYHGVRSLYFYRKHDYENAMLEASRFDLPGFFWGPIQRIPPLAQLGRIDEAKKEFEHLLNLRPDFISRGRYLLKMYIKEDTMIEHFLEGFEKMGVKID